MAKRRDLLKMAGFSPLAVWAAGPSKLPNGVVSAGSAKLTRASFGDTRIYHSGATDQVKAMTAGSVLLKPGMAPHPEHTHEEEEFLLVTEGSGEIKVEGAISQAGPGTMMYCAAGKLHGIVNTGKTPLLFYFYKWKA